MTYLQNIGKYFLMVREMFRKPTKWSVMRTLIFKDIDDIQERYGLVEGDFVTSAGATETENNFTDTICIVAFFICMSERKYSNVH